MKNLQPHETQLRGSWVTIDKQVVGDPVSSRIHYLIGEVLVEVGRSADGWSTLFRDPADGRYWELSYPNSEMHGGGPQQLSFLHHESAERKYDLR